MKMSRNIPPAAPVMVPMMTLTHTGYPATMLFSTPTTVKSAMPTAIKNKECIVQPDDIFPEYQHKDKGESRNDNIGCLLHPERGHIQHDIPQSTASDCRHKTHHIRPEPVEILRCRQTDAAYRKCESPYIVYYIDEFHNESMPFGRFWGAKIAK